jgi:hypothetical protein
MGDHADRLTDKLPAWSIPLLLVGGGGAAGVGGMSITFGGGSPSAPQETQLAQCVPASVEAELENTKAELEHVRRGLDGMIESLLAITSACGEKEEEWQTFTPGR